MHNVCRGSPNLSPLPKKSDQLPQDQEEYFFFFGVGGWLYILNGDICDTGHVLNQGSQNRAIYAIYLECNIMVYDFKEKWRDNTSHRLHMTYKVAHHDLQFATPLKLKT